MKNLSHDQRLFFALWPDDATRTALQALQPLLGGTPSRCDKLHLTLAFLGQRPHADLPDLLALLAQAPAHAMRLELEHIDHFPRLALGWAGMRATPPALLDLRAHLLQACKDEHEREQHCFMPHVTLARKIPPLEATPIAPIVWHATQLVLVESLPGSGDYRILAERTLI